MASITERNGKYFIMVSTGYDSTGKQIRKTMTYKPEPSMTQKQIEKAVNEQAVTFEKKVLSGQVLDGSVTFADFAERWMRDYAEPNLAPKTLSRYKAMLKRILPEIGHIKLDKLQPHHIVELNSSLSGDTNRRGITFLATQAFFDDFERNKWTREWLALETGKHINTIYNIFNKTPVAESTAQKVCDVLGYSFDKAFEPSKPLKGITNKTITHHFRLVSAILSQAVYWQVIPSNPATRVKPPKVARTEAKYLDEKQTLELIQLLEKEPIMYQAMIKLFIYSGLRRGELCGLEWKDIDWANHMISVRRSSQYLPGKGIFTKETKTVTSDRTIKLPSQAFDLLKEYRMWQLEHRFKAGDRWEDTDRIFTKADGTAIHPDTVTEYFRLFIAKTDLPQISIHSLRHTNITLQIAAGVPLRTVSYRAGHSSTQVTGVVYSHVIRSSEEKAAQILEDILDPMGKGQNRNIV